MKKNPEQISEEDNSETKAFLMEVLQDLVSLRSYIYDGKIIPAHRNTQKICDKIVAKVKEL